MGLTAQQLWLSTVPAQQGQGSSRDRDRAAPPWEGAGTSRPRRWGICPRPRCGAQRPQHPHRGRGDAVSTYHSNSLFILLLLFGASRKRRFPGPEREPGRTQVHHLARCPRRWQPHTAKARGGIPSPCWCRSPPAPGLGPQSPGHCGIPQVPHRAAGRLLPAGSGEFTPSAGKLLHGRAVNPHTAPATPAAAT